MFDYLSLLLMIQFFTGLTLRFPQQVRTNCLIRTDHSLCSFTHGHLIRASERFILHILSHYFAIVNTAFRFSLKILHEHSGHFYIFCTKETVFIPKTVRLLLILHNLAIFRKFFLSALFHGQTDENTCFRPSAML